MKKKALLLHQLNTMKSDHQRNIGVTSSLYIRRSELFFFFCLVTVLHVPQLYKLAGTMQTLGIIESSNSRSYIILCMGLSVWMMEMFG